jgi:hypothetical protein
MRMRRRVSPLWLRDGRARLVQLHSPKGGLLRQAAGIVDLREPLERERQLVLIGLRHFGYALFQPFISPHKERFGVSILLLARERRAERELGEKRRPAVWLVLGSDGQALPCERLGLGEFVLIQQVIGEISKFISVEVGPLPGLFSYELPRQRSPLCSQRREAGLLQAASPRRQLTELWSPSARPGKRRSRP